MTYKLWLWFEGGMSINSNDQEDPQKVEVKVEVKVKEDKEKDVKDRKLVQVEIRVKEGMCVEEIAAIIIIMKAQHRVNLQLKSKL